jgi:hypothetical protein
MAHKGFHGGQAIIEVVVIDGAAGPKPRKASGVGSMLLARWMAGMTGEGMVQCGLCWGVLGGKGKLGAADSLCGSGVCAVVVALS